MGSTSGLPNILRSDSSNIRIIRNAIDVCRHCQVGYSCLSFELISLINGGSESDNVFFLVIRNEVFFFGHAANVLMSVSSELAIESFFFLRASMNRA